MVAQQIPVTNFPNQKFSVVLNINGENRQLEFKFSWNLTAQYWVMRIVDPATSKIIIDSVPLVAGKENTESLNILNQYGYLGIGNAYLISTVDAPSSPSPTEETLGTEFILIWEG